MEVQALTDPDLLSVQPAGNPEGSSNSSPSNPKGSSSSAELITSINISSADSGLPATLSSEPEPDNVRIVSRPSSRMSGRAEPSRRVSRHTEDDIDTRPSSGVGTPRSLSRQSSTSGADSQTSSGFKRRNYGSVRFHTDGVTRLKIEDQCEEVDPEPGTPLLHGNLEPREPWTQSQTYQTLSDLSHPSTTASGLTQGPSGVINTSSHDAIIHLPYPSPPLATRSVDQPDTVLQVGEEPGDINGVVKPDNVIIPELTFIPDEPLKTLLSFFFLLFGFSFTTLSLSVTHERMPDYPPLPDIVLDNTIYREWGLAGTEYIIIVMTLTAFTLVLIHKHRMIVFRRIFLMVGMLYFYRGITMYITVLPKPDTTYYCSPKLNHSITFIEIMQRFVKISSGGGFSIAGNQVYCGDFIFSGHTMAMLLAFFVIREYSPRNWIIFHGIALCALVTGVVFLLLGRGHYSIDVFIAYWVTSRLWWFYHTLAHNNNLKVRGEHNFVSNMWWWWIFRYFEASVPGPLPRVYSAPYPRSFVNWIRQTWNSRRGSGYTEI